MPAEIECRDVSAGYQAAPGAPAAVLRGVSFSVENAGRLVIIGESGSGKSTLLRLLNRFQDPLAGTVTFRGAPLATYDPLALRRRVALVMQTPVVFQGTVRENLIVRPKNAPAPAPIPRPPPAPTDEWTPGPRVG